MQQISQCSYPGGEAVAELLLPRRWHLHVTLAPGSRSVLCMLMSLSPNLQTSRNVPVGNSTCYKHFVYVFAQVGPHVFLTSFLDR